MRITCQCGTDLDVPPGYANRTLACNTCQTKLRVSVPPGVSSIREEDLNGRLVIEQGPKDVGEIFVLAGEGPIEVGKLAPKPIVLEGTMVSRNHCRLVRQDGVWTIEDLKSTNGLYVNGQRVSTAKLNRDDVVKIGEYDLRFVSDIQAPAQQPVKPAAARPAPAKPAAAAPAPRGPAKAAPPPPAKAVPEDDPLAAFDGEGLFDLAPEPEAPKATAAPVTSAYVTHKKSTGALRAEAAARADQNVPMDGPPCPACGQNIARNGKICAPCGIQVPSGRPLLTASEVDENALYENAEKAIWFVSWVVPLTPFPMPLASEAYGNRKPYTTWAVAALTTLVSAFFFFAVNSDPNGSAKNMILWPKQTEFALAAESSHPDVAREPAPSPAPTVTPKATAAAPDPEAAAKAKAIMEKEVTDEVDRSLTFYKYQDWVRLAKSYEEADDPELRQQFAKYLAAQKGKSADPAEEPVDAAKHMMRDNQIKAELAARVEMERQRELARQQGRNPDDEEEDEEPVSSRRRSFARVSQPMTLGEFQPSQLLTHALIHDPSDFISLLLHLGGNMLFLLVFGSRVNALIGNVAAAIVYPILAIASALIQLTFAPAPLIGASGAIMGLAGMYFILFPVHRVFCSMWIRIWHPWRFWRTWLGFKIFKLRGFWILLIYIGWDILMQVLLTKLSHGQQHGGTAHWAHIGGFFTGMFIAIALLIARFPGARGSDLLSVSIGKFAWPLIGKPQRATVALG